MSLTLSHHSIASPSHCPGKPLPSVTGAAHLKCVPEEGGQALKAERLQAVMDALPAAVLVLDGRGRVTECNPAAEILLDLSLKGRVWRELIQELFDPQATSGDALALRNGRLVTLSTHPLGTEPGQVLMLQDVTATYQLRARVEHHRRLADMGRMAASLAHQIRTPLSSALLYLSRLKSTSLAQDKRERFLGKAMDSLNGLAQLISDMLLFVNGGNGQREAVRPGDLLMTLEEELRVTCQEKGGQFELLASELPCQVLVNRVLLKSALQNLVNNALEAGAGLVQLALRQNGEWCELVVRDNGPGIPLAAQQSIFEPFVSGRSEGTGLGLAVVRAVAQSMGGGVLLASQPGQGAEFVIRLPAVAGDDTPATMQQQG